MWPPFVIAGIWIGGGTAYGLTAGADPFAYTFVALGTLLALALVIYQLFASLVAE